MDKRPKRGQLTQAAEELIEQLLDWDEQNRTSNLTQMEGGVLALRQHLRQEMVSAVQRPPLLAGVIGARRCSIKVRRSYH